MWSCEVSLMLIVIAISLSEMHIIFRVPCKSHFVLCPPFQSYSVKVQTPANTSAQICILTEIQKKPITPRPREVPSKWVTACTVVGETEGHLLIWEKKKLKCILRKQCCNFTPWKINNQFWVESCIQVKHLNGFLKVSYFTQFQILTFHLRLQWSSLKQLIIQEKALYISRKQHI